MTADLLAAFHAALTPYARRICPNRPDDTALIHALLRGDTWTPVALAAHVGANDRGLTLTTARMRFRLRRAAGQYDDHEETND